MEKFINQNWVLKEKFKKLINRQIKSKLNIFLTLKVYFLIAVLLFF